jgi:hypothetical protein
LEVGRARAKIVEAHGVAAGAELQNELIGGAQIVHPAGFRDLEHQAIP